MQVRLILYYLQLKSPTFGNAYKSAIKAGYSKTYARNITTRFLKRNRFKELAELADVYIWVLKDPPEEVKKQFPELWG